MIVPPGYVLPDLTADAYEVVIADVGLVYRRIQLVRRRAPSWLRRMVRSRRARSVPSGHSTNSCSTPRSAATARPTGATPRSWRRRWRRRRTRSSSRATPSTSGRGGRGPSRPGIRRIRAAPRGSATAGCSAPAGSAGRRPCGATTTAPAAATARPTGATPRSWRRRWRRRRTPSGHSTNSCSTPR
jgi:hypothetical protein